MSAITQIPAWHFDGGANLNAGARDGVDSMVLAEIVQSLITQGNAADAAIALSSVFQTVEWTNPALADVDFFVDGRASSASPDVITYGEAEWKTVTELLPPRNANITTTLHADIDAVAVVLTGRVRDKNGVLVAQTDTITLTNGGGATDVGTKAFSFLDSVSIPAQSGVGGVIDVGFGVTIGMPTPIVTRAGLTRPIREVVAGAVVTNGVFTTAAAKAPNGTYTPNTAPDGANDYSLYYETDMP